MQKIFFTAVLSLILCQTALADLPAEKTVELKQDFKLPVENEAADLWVPLPMELKDYQTIVSENYTGNADQTEVKDLGNARVLHAHWAKAHNPELHLTNVLKVREHLGPVATSDDPKDFLKATAHVETDGIVQTTAKQITAKLKGNDEKAEAIYNWVVENTARDPNTRGCGVGDAKTTLTSAKLAGKCADINTLFVALNRASGIPAREVFGIRFDISSEFPSLGRTGDISKAQHCRAEYYSDKQKSWIPVDPADVRKAILEEKLGLNDPRIEKIRHKFFGYWEGNWAALNDGRDFTVMNQGEKVKVNYLMYPLLVSKSSSPDGMDPKEVGYSISSAVKAK